MTKRKFDTKGSILSTEILVKQVKALSSKNSNHFNQILSQINLSPEWIESMVPRVIPRDRYDRRLLNRGKDYEIVIATWPKGVSTLIHDHGASQSQGAVRVLRGEIFNHTYNKVNENQVSPDLELVHKQGELIDVPQGLIHAMGNNTEDCFSMSLHIYTPAIVNVTYWDRETLTRVKQQAVS